MLWAYFHCYQLTLDTYVSQQSASPCPVPTVVYNEKNNAVVHESEIEVGYTQMYMAIGSVKKTVHF